MQRWLVVTREYSTGRIIDRWLEQTPLVAEMRAWELRDAHWRDEDIQVEVMGVRHDEDLPKERK